MTMTPLEQAPFSVLLEYATITQQLDIGSGLSPVQLIAKMRAADPDLLAIDVAPVQEAISATQKVEAGGPNGYRNDPKVEITIHSEEGPGGDRAVHINCNGQWVDVKRDVNVDLPFRFYLILQNAIGTNISQTEVDGRFITHRRDVRAVRYSVESVPSPAEIEAWHKRTSEINRPAKVKWMENKRARALAA